MAAVAATATSSTAAAFNNNNSSTHRRFITILSSRANGVRPTDLEHCLKAHCRRLVVTGNPLSGAHLLLQKERIAIRAYYQCDIDTFQEGRLNDDNDIKLDEDDEQQKHRSLDIRGSQEKNKTTTNVNNPPKTTNPLRGSHASKTTATTTNDKHTTVTENDFDNICSFLKSFETAIVLFIMDGPDQQIQQLDDMDSPLHKTERLVRHLSNTYTNKNLRVLMVPSTQAAIDSLILIANALSPEKKEVKLKYFRQKEIEFCIPNVETLQRTRSDLQQSNLDGDSNSSSSDGTEDQAGRQRVTIPPYDPKTMNAITNRVIGSLRWLVNESNSPDHELDRLLNHLPTLQAIATATGDDLDQTFIDDRMKKVLCDFFGTSCNDDRTSNRTAINTNTIDDPLMEMEMMTVGMTEISPFDDNTLDLGENMYGDVGVVNDALFPTKHNSTRNIPMESSKTSMFSCERFHGDFDRRTLDHQQTNLEYHFNDPWHQSELTSVNDGTARPPRQDAYSFAHQSFSQQDQWHHQCPPRHVYVPERHIHNSEISSYQQQVQNQFINQEVGMTSSYGHSELPWEHQHQHFMGDPGMAWMPPPVTNFTVPIQDRPVLFHRYGRQSYGTPMRSEEYDAHASDQEYISNRHSIQSFGRRIVRGLHSSGGRGVPLSTGRRFGRSGRGSSGFRRFR